MVSKTSAFVALLRGINVGARGKGRRDVPMAPLRALCEELGFGSVQTYIQSGNVVFTSTQALAAVEHRLELAIAERFGCEVPVVVRALRDVVRAAGSCPFADVDHRPELVHFGVAKAKLRLRAAEQLAPYCKAGEQVEVRGQAIWIDYVGGVARSKLTPAVLDRVFGSTVTLRNMKTLRAVAAMAG